LYSKGFFALRQFACLQCADTPSAMRGFICNKDRIKAGSQHEIRFHPGFAGQPDAGHLGTGMPN
jgi:hypothetical protein